MTCDRMRAMIEARGDRLFSREEEGRYDELERELAEINQAMHEAGADPWFPRPPAMPKERLTAAHIQNMKPHRGKPSR
jgi:hypothetical protein